MSQAASRWLRIPPLHTAAVGAVQLIVAGRRRVATEFDPARIGCNRHLADDRCRDVLPGQRQVNRRAIRDSRRVMQLRVRVRGRECSRIGQLKQRATERRRSQGRDGRQV